MTAAPTRPHGSSASPSALPRRAATVGALVAAALAGTAGRAVAGADDLDGFVPRKHKPKHGEELLPAADRHLVSRFSYGITPKLAKEVRRAGGAQRWFERQLNPKAIKDKKTDKIAHWWPSLHRSPAELWQRQSDGIEGGWEVMDDYARWRADAADDVQAPAARGDDRVLGEPPPRRRRSATPQFTWRVDYGNTIRKHALGRFDEMLRASTTHPAMLIYLDAGESTKDHPNENLGRELLELHTVGVGNYNEKDVVGLGPDPDRLLGRLLEELAAAVQRRRPLPRQGQGQGLQGQEQQDRRQGHHLELPALPGPPPGHRRAHRLQALREVRRRQAAEGAGPAPGQGLPRQRHRDRPGAAARWSPPGPSSRRTTRRCATPARTSSRRTACSA